MADRRKHPRTTCELRVRWQRVHAGRDEREPPATTGPVEAASARDMSRSGLAFTSASPLAVGETLMLSLERSFGGPPLSALGRVARCEREGERWLVGVELTWIECAAPEQALGLSPENAWTLL